MAENERAPLRPTEPQHGTPRDDTSGSYALLEGCVMRGLFGGVHDATRRVLERAGYRQLKAPGQACCGALHAHAGRLPEAQELARRNIEWFEATGADWLIVNSAGCGAAIKEYPAWLVASSEWAERGERVAASLRDIMQLAAANRERRAGRLRGRVAYDAPCHLLHGQGVRNEPTEALGRVDGLTVELLPSYDRCCGGAGVFGLLQTRLSRQVLEPKLREIRKGRYEAVVSGNPGCVMQIGAGLAAAGVRTPVLHPVELLDIALRRDEERPLTTAGQERSAATAGEV